MEAVFEPGDKVFVNSIRNAGEVVWVNDDDYPTYEVKLSCGTIHECGADDLSL